MTRPPWEVADIIRRAGSKFLERYPQSLTWAQVKVLTAIAHCRTAALGGHRDRCLRCGYQTISYNSCRNRHCPKCQTSAREKWLHQRQQELLPVGYYHLVFSLPHSLVPLVWQNKRVLFTLLFEATAATFAGSGGRSQTSRCAARISQHPAHLGTNLAAASPRSLCGAGRRAVTRPPALDRFTHSLLPAGESAQPSFSWEVRRGLASCRS